MLSSILLSLLIGLIIGFLGGLFFYARKVHKNIPVNEITRATVNSVILPENQPGDFIEVNHVTNYIKEHEGEEIRLGDLIEE